MATFVRSGLVILGVLSMVGGLALITTFDMGAIPGLQLVGFGAFLVIVVALERSRYRSDSAEQSNATPGPGGGEPPGSLESRFRATSEVFVDPTTGHQMRVLVDPATGDRRYVAEG